MIPPRQSLPSLTDRLPLGSSGLDVSPICGGMCGDPKTIPAMFEAGINFFFLSADMHWPLYENVRKGLDDLLRAHPSRRDEIVVACVAYVTQKEFCFAPFQEVLMAVPSLQRIDVTVAGGAYGNEIMVRLETFKAHRAVNWVGARAIGSSFHDRKAARDVLELDVLDFELVRYNPVYAKARDDLFPYVKPREQRKTLLYNFKSTDSYIDNDAQYAQLGVTEDNWKPHVTDYYRFALTSPALDGLLVGLDTPDQVGALADALAKGPLDDEDHQYLLDLGVLERRRRHAETVQRLKNIAATMAK